MSKKIFFVLHSQDRLGEEFAFIILKKLLHCHLLSNMTVEKSVFCFFVRNLCFLSRIL